MLRQSFLYVGIFVLACFMLPRVSKRREFRRKVYRPLLSSFLTLCDLWRRAARNLRTANGFRGSTGRKRPGGLAAHAQRCRNVTALSAVPERCSSVNALQPGFHWLSGQMRNISMTSQRRCP